VEAAQVSIPAASTINCLKSKVFSGHEIARHHTGTTSLDPPQRRAEEIGVEPPLPCRSRGLICHRE
jgi:hypothetical protein